MDLTTRCPNCSTVFQASLQDLQLRKGYIRCVQCAHIFDGYAEVQSDPQANFSVSAPEVPGVSDPAEAPRRDPGFSGLRAGLTPDPQVFRSGRDTHEPRFTVGVTLDDDARDPSIGPGASEGSSSWPVGSGASDRIMITTGAARQSDGHQAAPFVIDPHPARGGRGGSAAPLMDDDDGPGLLASMGRGFMALLVGVLLLLMLAQLAYVYRAQLAQAVPAARPILERACVSLHCQVPYARDLSRLSISGSALRAAGQASAQAAAGQAAPGRGEPSSEPDQAEKAGPDHEAQHRFVLHVTLRNLGDQPQEWPTIVLDLNDASGTRLVRRNLGPQDYLSPAQLQQPFAAHQELLLRLPLTVTGVQVNGYQLDLFFP